MKAPRNSKGRSWLLWLRFLLPTTIITLALFLLYLFICHGLYLLFRYEYHLVGALVWGSLSFLFVSWLTSFLILMFSDPGTIDNELTHLSEPHDCHFTCDKCGLVKPFRAHHCSKCGYCFARMDHHCYALGICVALRNNKLFILFLFYMIVMLLIYGITSACLIFVIPFPDFPSFLLMDAFVGISLAILAGMILGVHLYQLLVGRTTMEFDLNIRITDGLTPYQRFQDVFGPPSAQWILPTPLDYAAVSPFKWEYLRRRQGPQVVDEVEEHGETEASEKEKQE
jgi:hypothetical protein